MGSRFGSRLGVQKGGGGVHVLSTPYSDAPCIIGLNGLLYIAISKILSKNTQLLYSATEC